jgi:hypothetical protein
VGGLRHVLLSLVLEGHGREPYQATLTDPHRRSCQLASSRQNHRSFKQPKMGTGQQAEAKSETQFFVQDGGQACRSEWAGLEGRPATDRTRTKYTNAYSVNLRHPRRANSRCSPFLALTGFGDRQTRRKNDYSRSNSRVSTLTKDIQISHLLCSQLVSAIPLCMLFLWDSSLRRAVGHVCGTEERYVRLFHRIDACKQAPICFDRN